VSASESFPSHPSSQLRLDSPFYAILLSCSLCENRAELSSFSAEERRFDLFLSAEAALPSKKALQAAQTKVLEGKRVNEKRAIRRAKSQVGVVSVCTVH
jgi:hypothetical protein